MALKVSTGLRNHMLTVGPFKNAMDGGFLRIYSGTVPADADAAISGPVLLVQLSLNGLGVSGLTFEAPAVNGIISKTTAEVWQGTNVSAGTATFFRFVKGSDLHGVSTTEVRLQGSVAVVGGELNLSSVTLSNGAQQTVNHFNVALPTL
jgi:hypothetical protein